MLRFSALSLVSVLILFGCATPPRLPPGTPATYVSAPEQCVPYARRVSGIQLYGDAHSWWNKASPRYGCGQSPQIGSVLILAGTRQMPEGHVAVVSSITDPRHITVNHSNWGNDRGRRRVVYHAMPVEDISPANDWTRVKFWNYEKNVYGFPYAAKGFIYNTPASNAAVFPSQQSR